MIVQIWSVRVFFLTKKSPFSCLSVSTVAVADIQIEALTLWLPGHARPPGWRLGPSLSDATKSSKNMGHATWVAHVK